MEKKQFSVSTKVGYATLIDYINKQELPSPDAQTERGYACFLSSLRIFTNCFEQNGNHQTAAKDHLLRILANLTKFPPAVRAMYTIINQSMPLEEDCAALIQSLHQLAEKFMPPDMMNYDSRRTLELVRPLFGYLHQQSNIKYKRDNTGVFPYLALFDKHSLVCSITREPVVNPIELPNDGGIMEYELANQYANGHLRMTNDGCPRMLDTSGITDLKQLVLLSGGRFANLVSCTFNSAITERYDDPSDELLAPLDVDVKQLCASLSTGPFAIIPPMDLHGANTSVLTFDERGWLAVFMGYKPCGVPPAK